MTELPTTFGKYFLTDKLAIGGMAEIFLAKLIGPGGFEKAMVIKQIHPALSSQRAFVDLFVAEAKTLVSLSQSNIVPIYELGVVDDTYFIAMEYVDGPTLWQLTEAVFARGAAIAPAIAAHIAGEIAKGLDYAHRKGLGVIHRDLSPRNVMLTRDGEVKLVDFGIAVALGEGTDAGEGGLPTGSFPYMSPEQAARKPLTGQTDLFSLGVLTWEMLTGRRLFARKDADATLAAVASAPIATPSSIVPAVPKRLDAIVMRALERDLDKRWASAAELGAALQRFLADETDLRGARELDALVARVCPPTVGALTAAAQDAPATQHDAPAAASGDGGPSTIVVPREPARGKRKPTVREATFATHVELERVLGPVTPAMARAPAGPPRTGAATTTGERATDAGAPAAGAPATADATDAPTGEYLPPTGEYTPPPARAARAALDEPATTMPTMPPMRQRVRTLAAVAIVIAALALLYARCPGRHAAAPPIDAAIAPLDAPAALDAPAIDAASPTPPPPDAAPSDARGPAPPRDAREPTAPHDGREPPARDAREPAAHPDAATAASGRLRVGADPWGEVFLDGKRLGRAPNEWTVPAGHHTVEVVFPGEETEQRRRFDVDVPAGGSQSVLADFRTP